MAVRFYVVNQGTDKSFTVYDKLNSDEKQNKQTVEIKTGEKRAFDVTRYQTSSGHVKVTKHVSGIEVTIYDNFVFENQEIEDRDPHLQSPSEGNPQEKAA